MQDRPLPEGRLRCHGTHTGTNRRYTFTQDPEPEEKIDTLWAISGIRRESRGADMITYYLILML